MLICAQFELFCKIQSQDGPKTFVAIILAEEGSYCSAELHLNFGSIVNLKA